MAPPGPSSARRKLCELDVIFPSNTTDRRLMSLKTTGVPFSVHTPERRYTLVSSEQSIKLLGQAKEEHMSLIATAEEVRRTGFGYLCMANQIQAFPTAAYNEWSRAESAWDAA